MRVAAPPRLRRGSVARPVVSGTVALLAPKSSAVSKYAIKSYRSGLNQARSFARSGLTKPTCDVTFGGPRQSSQRGEIRAHLGFHGAR